MLSVPFSVDEYEGFVEAAGLIRIEEDSVILEYKKKEGVFGIPVSELKEKRIPISELSAVSYKKKIFGAKLVITGHKMSTFADIPGSQNAEIILGIARKDREAAQELEANLSLQIAEVRLRELDKQ